MRLLINEGSLTWDKCSFICIYSYVTAPSDEEARIPKPARAAGPSPPSRPEPMQFDLYDGDSSMHEDIDEDNPTTPDIHRRTDTETDRSRSSGPRPFAPPVKPFRPPVKPLAPPAKASSSSGPDADMLPPPSRKAAPATDSDRTRSDHSTRRPQRPPSLPKGSTPAAPPPKLQASSSTDTDTTRSRSQRGQKLEVTTRPPPPAPPGAGKAKSSSSAAASSLQKPSAPSATDHVPILPVVTDDSTDTDATQAYPEASPDAAAVDLPSSTDDEALLAWQLEGGKTYELCCEDFDLEIRQAYNTFCQSPALHTYSVAACSWTFNGQRCHDGLDFWKGQPGLQGQGPWHTTTHFAVALVDGACYRVDAETDNLSHEEMQRHEHKVMEADRAELDNFLNHKVFHPRLRRPGDQRPIDCTWVRKWKHKKLDNGTTMKQVKSRLCCRCFLDPQKNFLNI